MHLTYRTLQAIELLIELSTYDLPIPRTNLKSWQTDDRSPYVADEILQSLRREGLVQSSSGSNGGYVLMVPLSEITVQQVQHLVERPFTFKTGPESQQLVQFLGQRLAKITLEQLIVHPET